MDFKDYRHERKIRTFKRVSKLVCLHSKLKAADFLDSKDESVIKARHLAMFLCREYAPAESEEVAKFFDVSTATVSYAVRKIKALLSKKDTASDWIRNVAKNVLITLEEGHDCK